jgi:hypothetical protein
MDYGYYDEDEEDICVDGKRAKLEVNDYLKYSLQIRSSILFPKWLIINKQRQTNLKKTCLR